MHHIAIVDDDPILRNRLKKFLEKENFRASAVGDGAALRALVADDPPDLVLMDLQLPGEDGLSLTRYLRERTEIPVLILTGKGDTIDRVVGLEMGADDYLAKPFSLRELLARIKIILRRVAPRRSEAVPAELTQPAERLQFGTWVIDFTAIELRNADGESIHLTSAEFRLLEALVRNPGRTLSRDQLIDAMADRSWNPTDRSVDLHISHLRKKIEADTRKPSLIKTVRGFGYVFAGSPVAV
ncbi:MAG: DNA-binding response OmpR family regulator [Paracoccaceae bacterium]|jgi:DNA-binding response OmpR family regulator